MIFAVISDAFWINLRSQFRIKSALQILHIAMASSASSSLKRKANEDASWLHMCFAPPNPCCAVSPHEAMSNQDTSGDGSKLVRDRIDLPEAFKWMRGGRILPTPPIRNFAAASVPRKKSMHGHTVCIATFEVFNLAPTIQHRQLQLKHLMDAT